MTLQVFISYKSEYRDFAREIKNELNEWGFETWLDVDNIQPGDYFRHKIQEGLDSSDVLLMVLTEEAQLSREVMAEVDYFLDVAKKPVVPLRHRECKPLYIFVSIQYIDFVTNQANGFVQLKQRLNELAQSALPSTSDAKPEPMIEEAQKPGAVIIEDGPLSEKEKKETVLDDFIGGGMAEEEESTNPPPPPPKPITQQAPAFGSAPAAPIIQPQRQAESMPMPQPAATRAKRSSPLIWPLAAAAGLVIVVGAVVLFSSNANVTLATTEPSQGTSPLVWIMAAAAMIAVGFWGWRRFAQTKTREGLRPSPTDDTKNRAVMLQNVEDFWLKGVLDPALEAGTLDIGLSSAPGAVLRHKDYGDYELPPNANILDVFNDMNRELLILGAPGGGKTVLLLQLAKALIGQAKNPHLPTSSPSGRGGEEPIPVVFNLSSWGAERKPLAAWLVDELRQKYQVSRKQATAWVEGEKLLLLLDGLDEVAEPYRNECVDAINTYRQQYRTVDLAVCSRVADYEALTSKLDVRGAIVLEPLTADQIVDFLAHPKFLTLQQAIINDRQLQKMAPIPFLLNVMAYAYSDMTSEQIQVPKIDNTAKVRRTHVFNTWVEKRLATTPSLEYTQIKLQKWLGWLARMFIATNAYELAQDHLADSITELIIGLSKDLPTAQNDDTQSSEDQNQVLAFSQNEIEHIVDYVFKQNEDILSQLPNVRHSQKKLQEYYNISGLIFFPHNLPKTVHLRLWWDGLAPYNYARFLDYCASAGIMRKVGGGYIFAHRYLLEYFAELEAKNGEDD